MCLISFNWLDHPIYKLILIANKDEFFNRKSSSLQLWQTGFYAGKDLKGGGTWLGLHPKGKFAALTNYRNLARPNKNPITRGKLVKDFLENEEGPFEYLGRIQEKGDQYNGFNLLVADGEEMGYLCNNLNNIQKVSPGLHGISNAFLDTPWPKVVKAKDELSKLMDKEGIKEEALMNLLQSRSYTPDELLPHTGVSVEMERILSAQFIKYKEEYGTVNTSGVLWKHDGSVVFIEKWTNPLVKTQKEFKISSTPSNTKCFRDGADPGSVGF